MHRLIIAAVVALAAPLSAQSAPQVSEARLRADVEHLVGFGTRHTMSVQDDPKRGIGAARRWAEAEFRRTAAVVSGNCFFTGKPAVKQNFVARAY